MKDIDMMVMEETATTTENEEKPKNNIAWRKWGLVFFCIFMIKPLFITVMALFGN